MFCKFRSWGPAGLRLVSTTALKKSRHGRHVRAASDSEFSFNPYERGLSYRSNGIVIYFAATLVLLTLLNVSFLVRTITMFGFSGNLRSNPSLLPVDACFIGFAKCAKQAFGPFINRHHFAGYMELTTLPLGLILSGGREKEKKVYLHVCRRFDGLSLDNDKLARRNYQAWRQNVLFLVSLME